MGNLLHYHSVKRMPNSAEIPRRDVFDEATKPALFEQIIYWITVSRDEFDVPKFRASVPSLVRDRDDVMVQIASEKNTVGPYHALFGWTIGDEEVDLNIEYYAGPLVEVSGEPPASDTNDKDADGPPAESLMLWLGQFFATETVSSHAHARYRYPAPLREATFDLSLAKEAPHGARLYGVALQLPSKPGGVVSVRITRGSSDWYAELIADRDITFRGFSPLAESNALETFLSSFLRETQS